MVRGHTHSLTCPRLPQRGRWVRSPIPNPGCQESTSVGCSLRAWTARMGGRGLQTQGDQCLYSCASCARACTLTSMPTAHVTAGWREMACGPGWVVRARGQGRSGERSQQHGRNRPWYCGVCARPRVSGPQDTVLSQLCATCGFFSGLHPWEQEATGLWRPGGGRLHPRPCVVRGRQAPLLGWGPGERGARQSQAPSARGTLAVR